MRVDDGGEPPLMHQDLDLARIADAAAIAAEMENLDGWIGVEDLAQGGAGAEGDMAGKFCLLAMGQELDREILGSGKAIRGERNPAVNAIAATR